MSGNCYQCQHWTVRRETAYRGTNEVIVNWTAPKNKGACALLGIETDRAFGCNRHVEDFGEHVEHTVKEGEPHQHWIMIDCPDCGGAGDGSRGHRCGGTGKVRLYDDGFVGDEVSRTHPKEKPAPSNCMHCSASVNREWAHCPSCGGRLWIEPAKTEIVSNEMAGLPPAEPA